MIQAQSSAKDQLGTWYMYNGSHKLSDQIKLTTSAHYRYFELATEYQQEIYRVGLNYAFNKKINVTGGMVYSIKDTSYKTTAPDLYEYRFYQDLNLKDTWGKINVKHRVRLAQRFTKQNFIDKTKHRIRYGLFLKYPILKKLNFYAFNEVFIKFATKAFGENRTGAGFIRKINENLKVRFGYFHIKFADGGLDRLQLGILLNTDFTKKTI